MMLAALRGVVLGLGVTAVALGVTYFGFLAVDARNDRALTFPAPQAVKERIEDEKPEPTVTTNEIEVPNVVGDPYLDAKEKLAAAGLAVHPTGVESDAEPGTVVDQDPDAGVLVEGGSVVRLSVSPVEVPNVVGQTQSAARSTLETLEFEVVTSTELVSDESLVGDVLAQSESPESLAKYGWVITLTVVRVRKPP